MNTVTVELSDQALADLHAVQLKLRAKWKCIAPGSLDTSLSHAAGLSDIAVCHA